MLIGEYQTKISSKKRVAIPKKIRAEIGEKMIISRGYEEALILVNDKMWGNLSREITNGSFINKNIRDTTRFLVGSAVELNPDQQGRVVIPDPLADYAQLLSGKEIVFVGLINWVEIWSKSNWNNRLKFIIENSDKISSELNETVSDGE